MTAGEVSLKVVADRLGQVDRWLSGLRAIPVDSLAAFKADPRNPAAAESFLRRGIEALLDVARHLLAKGYGLGALEYREVARRAADKGFLGDRELEVRFEQVAGFRNRLTHYYSDVTTEELFEILSRHSQDIEVADSASPPPRLSQKALVPDPVNAHARGGPASGIALNRRSGRSTGDAASIAPPVPRSG